VALSSNRRRVILCTNRIAFRSSRPWPGCQGALRVGKPVSRKASPALSRNCRISDP